MLALQRTMRISKGYQPRFASSIPTLPMAVLAQRKCVPSSMSPVSSFPRALTMRDRRQVYTLPSVPNYTYRRWPTPQARRHCPHYKSHTLASISFRGPEYIAHPDAEGIAQLMFDVPRTARTISVHPRHGGGADEDEDESDVFKRHTPPLFEVRGVIAVRIAMPPRRKDIVLPCLRHRQNHTRIQLRTHTQTFTDQTLPSMHTPPRLPRYHYCYNRSQFL
ncbi:hypothetical protein BJV78DRAFT_441883 [Lactifluus subvellereus]|nr:hypothetical protein BJV78DRAFT_441883 [Lactifluus subvellereus]